MSRSLKLCSRYIKVVKSSLLRHGFPSQKILAETLGISQSTVSHFLNGKPVDYLNFVEICHYLGLSWQEVADLEVNLAKITISDHRGSPSTITPQLELALSTAGYQIYTDTNKYLFESDYLILILSEQTVLSELIIEEIHLAKQLQDNNSGKPFILPLCINLQENTPIPYDLLASLRNIQPWGWKGEKLEIVITELLVVLAQNLDHLPQEHQLAYQWPQKQPQIKPNLPLASAAPEIPTGQVELSSYYYIERPPIEARAFTTITQPGSLIRIKAPRQMGKTSLMARILSHAQQFGAHTVVLNFQLANQKLLINSETFLKWFAASISLELGLFNPNKFQEYWQLAEIIGSNQCCKAYFEQYLLPQLNTPLTLGLDEVDRVFGCLEIADDFFGLLRSLHEEAKRSPIWQNLRLIVVHSTEVYLPLDINKSPFNVGLPLELPEFNQQQVKKLAQRHQLDWQDTEINTIIELVGGHPYLLRLAMYHLTSRDLTWKQLLTQATTEVGIYADHLRRHWWNLQQNPQLLSGIKKIVTSNIPVVIPAIIAFKLYSMGLIKIEGNKSTYRCLLYQKYFNQNLS